MHAQTKKYKSVSYNKWGYIFLIPFVVAFLMFQFVPLVKTMYYSLYENYEDGLRVIGPNYVGLDNFKKIFSDGYIWKYARNTMVMWVLGFIPQIFFSLLLGAWFSDHRLNLKCQRFFKTVIYLPNLIMASAFAMLFFVLFSDNGPINDILQNVGILEQGKPYSFLDHKESVRTLIAFMNFIMWFGNTTILLMAGMMGVDPSLYEAAEVDGATATQVFFRITLPLLRPILIYVLVTSLIGGLQMFDVPQVLTNRTGNPMETSKTLIMYLNDQLYSKNYGKGGAISVVMFVLTSVLSIIVFRFTGNRDEK